VARKNKTRYAVLGFLSGGAKSGYDIKQESGQSVGYFWNESYGSIYPILRQLVKEDLITRELDTEDGIHDRYLYTLTQGGWDELRSWLRRPPELPILREELLLKIFFGKHGSIGDLVRHVTQCRWHYAGRLNSLEEIRRYHSTHETTNEDHPFWMMTLNMGLHRARAYITWCDETLRTLEDLSDSTA